MARRHFALNSVLLMLLAAPCFGGAVPVARFGVMSDIHAAKSGDEATFVKALRYFDEQKVDGVVLAGDMADTGRRSQLKLVADAWYSVFPNDCGADGRPVEKLFIYGNHDIDGHLWSELSRCDKDTVAQEALGVGDNRRTAWEECFHEPFAPIWMKRVKGVVFIGAHYKGRDNSTDIESFMKAHADEIDKAKPLFYIQHTMARNTAFGPWAEGADDGAVVRALSSYPMAVAFCGDTHYTLTDERSLWQGAFTVVNTASLKYSFLGYSMRENSHGGYNTSGFAGEDKVRKHCQPPLKTGDGRQAMLLEVYDDHLVLKRREFVTDSPLGDDWIVPLPADSARISYAARAAKRIAPEFAADAKVTVTSVTGTIREAKEPCAMLKVSFPAAEPRGGCRVFEYEVTATLVEDDFDLVQAQRRVFAPDCYLPPTAAPRPGSCRFALKELPIKGHYRFSVRPIECFGKKGAAIFSDIVLVGDDL